MRAGLRRPLGLEADLVAHRLPDPLAPLAGHLGFGRIVVSEIEAPNMLVELV
jgi:hypothetical protein